MAQTVLAMCPQNTVQMTFCQLHEKRSGTTVNHAPTPVTLNEVGKPIDIMARHAASPSWAPGTNMRPSRFDDGDPIFLCPMLMRKNTWPSDQPPTWAK